MPPSDDSAFRSANPGAEQASAASLPRIWRNSLRHKKIHLVMRVANAHCNTGTLSIARICTRLLQPCEEGNTSLLVCLLADLHRFAQIPPLPSAAPP